MIIIKMFFFKEYAIQLKSKKQLKQSSNKVFLETVCTTDRANVFKHCFTPFIIIFLKIIFLICD